MTTNTIPLVPLQRQTNTIKIQNDTQANTRCILSQTPSNMNTITMRRSFCKRRLDSPYGPSWCGLALLRPQKPSPRLSVPALLTQAERKTTQRKACFNHDTHRKFDEYMTRIVCSKSLHIEICKEVQKTVMDNNHGLITTNRYLGGLVQAMRKVRITFYTLLLHLFLITRQYTRNTP